MNNWRAARAEICEELAVSRLGFGTASLHRVPRKPDRVTLLRTAFDAGITHYDTAPLYGWGIAEDAIGITFRCNRPSVTIATKVGLYPPDLLTGSYAEVVTRKAFGVIWRDLSKAKVHWSLAKAKESFYSSLRRLRTDYVDVLFLHEPSATVLSTEEFALWGQQLRSAGSVRALGVAGPIATYERWITTQNPFLRIVQTRDGIETGDADALLAAGRALQFTYGYFQDARNGSTLISPRSVLRQALMKNRTGCVLYSSTRLANMSFLVHENFDS